MKKDIESLSVTAKLLSDNLEILSYLENTTLDTVNVTINNDYSFDLKDQMMATAMEAFKKQLESRIKILKQELVTSF